jgi:hypothetical protein
MSNFWGSVHSFAIDSRDELFLGNVSEDTYLRQVIARGGWGIGLERLKAVIRQNFHSEVEGSLPILTELASRYELALLSDHAREWIAYIQCLFIDDNPGNVSVAESVDIPGIRFVDAGQLAAELRVCLKNAEA